MSLSYKGVGYIDKSKIIIADCVLSMLKLCIVNRMFKNTKGRVPSEQRKRKKDIAWFGLLPKKLEN